MSQSQKPFVEIFSNTYDIFFAIVSILCTIIAFSCIKWIVKMRKTKEQPFKVNKLNYAFFIISPILLIVLVITMLLIRIDAFYGIQVKQARFSPVYLSSIFGLLVINISIWVYKSLITKMFVEWKKEFMGWKEEFMKWIKKEKNEQKESKTQQPNDNIETN